MTNLAIDIGNTRTKTAVYDRGQLMCKEVWDKIDLPRVKELAYNQKVENVILSSTSAMPGELEEFLKESYFYLRLTSDTPLPITIHYQTPHTLGKDRIAAVAGALCLYPGENVLVIDAGTCITLDVMTSEAEFIGGNISPGIEMRLKAMNHFTANLPLVKRSGEIEATSQGQNPIFLGDSTENAIRNGAEMGALLEVTAFMERCRRRFGPLKVIFTGGDADFFVKNIKTKIFAHSNLVLRGLNKILQHNVENFEGKNSSKK